MLLACASDIHGHYDIDWPNADILVLAGDILPNLSGSKNLDASLQREFVHKDFLKTLKQLKRKYDDVVMIPGNHDRCFEYYPREMTEVIESIGVRCLIDSGVKIDKLNFWGSPWTPWFYGDHWSFNLTYAYTRRDAFEIWGKIPLDTDVLITHGPPYKVLDMAPRGMTPKGELSIEHVGCPYLLERIGAVNPRVHIFGHIHNGYGKIKIRNTIFLNAAVNTESHEPINPIQVVQI